MRRFPQFLSRLPLLPMLLAATLFAVSPGIQAQTVTIDFDGAPSGPLPWSEQGFNINGAGFGVWDTSLTSGQLSIFASGSGFGFADVGVSRADGGQFDAQSLDIVSVTGDIFDVAIWTDKTGPDWVRGPTGVGTDVLTGPDFEDIVFLAISAWPPSGASVTVRVDNIVVEKKTWSDQGSALAGVSGTPLNTGTGTLADGSANQVDLSGAAPQATAVPFFSLSSTPVPFKGGTLMPFPFLPPVFLTTSASGTISIPFVMPSGLPAGTELWVQWAIQDAAAVAGVALSNALMGLTP